MLEAGINPIAKVAAKAGSRRPAILLRSSEWKVGQASTPWHDLYDLDAGRVRYFGDHKAATKGPVGATPGNAALLEAWRLHQSSSEEDRLSAPPLLLFRSVRVGGRNKGYVQFCGVGLMERLEYIVQRDPLTGLSFSNLVTDIAVLETAFEAEHVDWRWIDDRNESDLPTAETLRFAPRSWSKWVKEGNEAIPRVRRRVLADKIRRVRDRVARVDSAEGRALWEVYRHFADDKHAFELVAARIAQVVLDAGQTQYRHGWITRRSGDGGADFVGRLDLAGGPARTSLVVLGQAKCLRPDSTSVTAENISRVVARLRRGWIGVYVTTATYSEAAQREVRDDEYPIALIDGLQLGEVVYRLSNETHAGDVTAWLESVAAAADPTADERRPEEILSLP